MSFLFEKQWRHSPHVIRQAIDPALLRGINLQTFRLIASERPYIRVFLSESPSNRNNYQARLIPAENASSVLDALITSSLKYTVLLNGVDAIHSDSRRIRKEMGVPFSWRLDDIVMTLSTQSSGIGYHAGHEDAIIVQAVGKRRWRVWNANKVDVQSKRRILLSASGDNNPLHPSKSPPMLECFLEAGDALYIPPFYPHEGLTIRDSISIALGWRGISYFHLLMAFQKLVPQHLIGDPALLPDEYYELLPDVKRPYGSRQSMYVASSVMSHLQRLGCTVSDTILLRKKLSALFSEAQIER